MKYLYAPGCALMSYKPHLADKLKEIIESRYGKMDTMLECCFTKPFLESGTHIITPCVTCASKYANIYPNCHVEFFLDVLAESDDFIFPDYGGLKMSIQDTCSSRSMPEIQATIRRLLERMNITLVEPERSGIKVKCCGQTLYGKTDIDKVKSFMIGRASEMPCNDVVVYCSSCIMSMTQGGKQPRYILDLIFDENTELKDDIETWNVKLADFRKNHLRKTGETCNK